MKKLLREFYTRSSTLLIARELLGKTLVIPDNNGKRVSGMIVETEAYQGPEDKAAHSYNNRRTKRTEVMFHEGGVVYIFLIYGIYFQFNIVTGKKDVPHAVLVRAIEPLDGIKTMRKRRGKMSDENLTSGPGKLAIALNIDKSFNGETLNGNRIWIENNRQIKKTPIISGKRIGIDYAEEYADKKWRFCLKDNQYLSR